MNAGYTWADVQGMSLAQIRVFSEAAARGELARRAQFIHDVSVAFHGKPKARKEYIEYLERLSGR